jgi:hypothetical protein
MHRYCTITLTLALGCGGAVNAGEYSYEIWRDEPSDAAAPKEPVQVYVGSDSIVAFAVNEERLYTPLSEYVARYQVRYRIDVCPIGRCGKERDTLFHPPPTSSVASGPLVLGGETLYWSQDSGRTILSCPTSGCLDGPLLVVDDAEPVFAADDEALYWSGPSDQHSLWRRTHDGSSTTQYSIPPTLPVIGAIAAYGDSLYLQTADQRRLLKLPKDGSEPPSILVDDFNIGYPSLTAEGIFYPRWTLNGQLLHCPLAGCDREPEPLAESRGWPTALHVDGQQMFWIGVMGSELPPGISVLGTVLSCDRPVCREIRTIAQAWVDPSLRSTSLAVNSRFVYWTRDDDFTRYQLWSLAR